MVAVDPIRVRMEAGDKHLLKSELMSDNRHDWVVANEMGTVLAAKGYDYQVVFAAEAGHTDLPTKQQTLLEALKYLWRGRSQGIRARQELS